jgi:hypothetical protein
MAKKSLPQLPVPDFVLDKAERLRREVAVLGHPRAFREDIVGALVDAATAPQAAKALEAYNRKLGKALAELESASDGAKPAP